MGPTWVPPGPCRPQMGPMLAPWTLLSGAAMIYTGVRSWNDLQRLDCRTGQHVSSPAMHAGWHSRSCKDARIYLRVLFKSLQQFKYKIISVKWPIYFLSWYGFVDFWGEIVVVGDGGKCKVTTPGVKQSCITMITACQPSSWGLVVILFKPAYITKICLWWLMI